MEHENKLHPSPITGKTHRLKKRILPNKSLLYKTEDRFSGFRQTIEFGWRKWIDWHAHTWEACLDDLLGRLDAYVGDAISWVSLEQLWRKSLVKFSVPLEMLLGDVVGVAVEATGVAAQGDVRIFSVRRIRRGRFGRH